MNSGIRQAQSFDANYQLLDLDLDRLQRRSKRMRNSWLLWFTLLTSVILFLFSNY
ncbi:MAG: hypothetical protein QNJ72_12820 [Pleurocapsa sp. MO_226.B13]|nr:hypothetical protein [Pleurocapsa sp. MO_226.B13]